MMIRHLSMMPMTLTYPLRQLMYHSSIPFTCCRVMFIIDPETIPILLLSTSRARVKRKILMPSCARTYNPLLFPKSTRIFRLWSMLFSLVYPFPDGHRSHSRFCDVQPFSNNAGDDLPRVKFESLCNVLARSSIK